jgi:hypothetical protein
MRAESIDYNGLMQANLARVFGEQDASRRMSAIAEIYANDATLHEPHASATGHAAISRAVETLLSSLPPNFVFTAIGPAVGHHGVGRLSWQSVPSKGPVAVTGTDVARIEGGESKPSTSFSTPPARDPLPAHLKEFPCPRPASTPCLARKTALSALGRVGK